MGILRGLLERRATLANPEGWLLDALGGQPTASGVRVTEETALKSTAVLACVRVLSETVASLPLILYRRREDGGKERAQEHPLYALLHDTPNPEQTSMEFREMLMAHLALWGNAYAQIVRDSAGRATQLWPLTPGRVSVRRQGSALQYIVTLPDGGQVGLLREQVLHVRGLSLDGFLGLSPIGAARQAVGLTLATEEFGARFFGNNARPGGVLEHPGKLSPESHNRLREDFERMHRGLTNAHRVAILEEGMKFHEVGIPPEDAQYLATRQFQLDEIARIFRVPPHLIQNLGRATWGNVEQMEIDFVVHTIRPYLVRWEQALTNVLLPRTDRQTYFPEFLVDGLLRGDTESRYRAYATARQNGWLSANDIRRLENMDPIEGGDVYLVPLNMVPASQVTSGTVDQPSDGEPTTTRRSVETRSWLSRRRVAKAWEPALRDMAYRIVRTEIEEIRRIAKATMGQRDLQSFTQRLEDWYRQKRSWIFDRSLPILRGIIGAAGDEAAQEIGYAGDLDPELDRFARAYADAYVRRHVAASVGQVAATVINAQEDGEDPEEALDERLSDWEVNRSSKIAMWEWVQASSAAAKAVFAAGGVTLIRWRSYGKSCPYCSALDGTVVDIDGAFLNPDSEFQPEGAERPLTTTVTVGHPPGHGGCDCALEAVTESRGTAGKWLDPERILRYYRYCDDSSGVI